MNILKKLLIAFVCFLVFLSASVYSIFFYMTNEMVISSEKHFIVSKGDTFKKTSNLLAKNGIIKFPELFYYTSRIIKKDKISIRSGEYLFKDRISPIDILDKLIEGDVYYRKLTIAEGLSTHSILELIDNAEGLVGDLPKDIKEGTLLPETYLYTYGDTKADLVARMQKAMQKVLDEEWEKRSHDVVDVLKTKEEALILASIVEKETGIPEERYDVASVFVNRLKIGMKVQSDPTVVYAFTFGDKSLEREIRKSDLARESPYNTYKIKGLPPTPIANPGKDAIKATLNPAKTDYLYFVATGNGGHNFSKDYNLHRKFVREYRKILNDEKSK